MRYGYDYGWRRGRFRRGYGGDYGFRGAPPRGPGLGRGYDRAYDRAAAIDRQRREERAFQEERAAPGMDLW